MNSDKLKVFGGPNGHPKYKVPATDKVPTNETYRGNVMWYNK